MTDPKPTPFYGGVPISTLIAVDALIKELPPFEALTEREMAVHRRAHEEGYRLAERLLKQKVTSNLQMAMWGHVL